ncbi:MAG: SBBP repeat-containing protein [Candidatus Kariarchaeaceae archaeon]
MNKKLLLIVTNIIVLMMISSSFSNVMSKEVEIECIFSTYIGGGGLEYSTSSAAWPAASVAVDSEGNIIITGRTTSLDFPSVGVSGLSNVRGMGAFVAKFSPDGQTLIFSTSFGGSGNDWGSNIAVDSKDNIIIIGTTLSADFPTENAYQENSNGGPFYAAEGFITKIGSDGTLIFSSYFGGSGDDWLYGLAIDSEDNIVISGNTFSDDLLMVNPYQSTLKTFDGFIAKFSEDGQAILYSTYLGGSANDWTMGLALDANDNIIAYGGTASTNFPTLNAFQETYGGGSYDTYITKFDKNGSSLIFSTYIGGTSKESLGNIGGNQGVNIDALGNIIVVGYTESSNFPTLNAFQESHGGGSNDAYITKFNENGSLIFSTYLGGEGVDDGISVTSDSLANIVIAGYTSSADFPLKNAFQDELGGVYDIFLAKFLPDGTFNTSSYFGGSNLDYAFDITFDQNDDLVVTGTTSSTDFPIYEAYQEDRDGNSDAFVAKFTMQEVVEDLSDDTNETDTEGDNKDDASFSIEMIAIPLGLIALVRMKKKE